MLEVETMNFDNHEQDQDTARQTYYVDIQGKQLHLQQGIAAYDLEIVASEAEAGQIEEQFRKLDERDEESAQFMLRFSFRGGENVFEKNGEYEQEMQKLFQLLHQYGTEATKRHIESMNIL